MPPIQHFAPPAGIKAPPLNPDPTATATATPEPPA